MFFKKMIFCLKKRSPSFVDLDRIHRISDPKTNILLVLTNDNYLYNYLHIQCRCTYSIQNNLFKLFLPFHTDSNLKNHFYLIFEKNFSLSTLS